LTTKIHAASDALGLPLHLIGGQGQQNDMALAHALIDGFKPGHVLADRGYDAGHLIDAIAQNKAQAVIPPRSCWKIQRDYDKELYKERNLIERFFNKLKQFRRVATRYDKLLVNYMGFVKIAAIAIWLK
jgi:putative transposase